MLPHDKHTCTFRIVYTLYVCNKRINTQLQSMWILNKPWWKEQNIGIPECGRERCGKIFDYASSKIFATSPFASKIFASPALCVYPFLSLHLKPTSRRQSRNLWKPGKSMSWEYALLRTDKLLWAVSILTWPSCIISQTGESNATNSFYGLLMCFCQISLPNKLKICWSCRYQAALLAGMY